MYLYSIYDAKADMWTPPFVAHSDDAAKRIVAVSSLNSGTMVDKFPADFTLFRIGSWDEGTGALCVDEASTSLGTVLQIIQQARQAVVPSVAPAEPTEDEENERS